MDTVFEFDVAISHAGTDRLLARQLAHLLRNAKLSVFFHEFEEATIWGQPLQEKLGDIYENQAQYCIILISQSYRERSWPQHELQAACRRRMRQYDYILPVRLDETLLNELPSDLAYVDIKNSSLKRIADLTIARLTCELMLPSDFDFDDWQQIEHVLDALERRAQVCNTPAELERWLLEWGQFSAVLDEVASRRYIAMTCDTADRDKENAYLSFVEKIEPRLKLRQRRMEDIFLDHPCREALPPKYHYFNTLITQREDLFKRRNIRLESEEARNAQEYQKLSGALTLHFRGQEKSLISMSRYLEDPDRRLRQETWELTASRRLRETHKFDDIFDKLVGLRRQMASNAGFSNYVEFAYRSRGRDYRPEDSTALHSAIECELMPLMRELQSDRKAKLRLSALRPWDLAIDPDYLPPLQPFHDVNQLLDATASILTEIDTSFGSEFRRWRNEGLLDLENRRNKAPGSYQSTLAKARQPFIFMNAVGVQRDVQTLFHHVGQALHSLASSREKFYFYRSTPIEFHEVISHVMELLGHQFLDRFYSSEDAERARREHLEELIECLPWMATVDAFQLEVYREPAMSKSERAALWTRQMDRFGGLVDWTGYEAARANLWHRQLHIFIHPFYFMEFGIGMLGALQIWANWHKSKSETIDRFKHALDLAGSRPLTQLFNAAGCNLDFTVLTLRPIIAQIRSALGY